MIQHTILKAALCHCRKDLDEDETTEEARSLPDRTEKPEESPDKAGLWEYAEGTPDITH